MTGVRGVAPENTGIASGLINTAQQVGGAVGLAGLAAVAGQATSRQLAHDTLPGALTHGYATGILVGGALYLVGIVIAALTLGVATAPLRSRSVGPHSG